MRLSTAVDEDRETDFDGFYAANFRDTVAMTYTLTADMVEAQDIAQEAFCRAWRRWARLRRYENPVAWVRRVAVNLARSRWRRLRIASSRLAGWQPEQVPALNPDHVAVVAALRKLPARQREALVLYHMMDLPLAEVAEHFEVPVGTVKSWLHRGRAAIADDLRVDVTAAITAPPLERIKQRPRGRVTAAVLAAVALSGAAAVFLVFGRGAPVPPVVDPIVKVDWRNATVSFPGSPGCPAGQMRFTGTAGVDGVTSIVVSAGNGKPVAGAATDQIVIGDLTGDGRPEAVMPMYCHAEGDALPRYFQLAVFAMRGDGTLYLAGTTHDNDRILRSMWIHLNVLYVHVWPEYGETQQGLGELRGYRLAVTAGLIRGGSGPYPALTDLNLTPVAQRLSCGDAPPEPGLRLRFDEDLFARAGGRVFALLDNGTGQIFVERGRTGMPYLVLKIVCRPADEVTLWAGDNTVVFDLIGLEWVAVDVS